MIVAVKEPGDPPEVRTIDGSLASLQGVIGGWVEAVRIGGGPGDLVLLRDLVLLMDEEGGLTGRPENRTRLGTFLGPLIVLGTVGADFRGLDPPELARALEWLGEPDDRTDGGLMAPPEGPDGVGS